MTIKDIDITRRGLIGLAAGGGAMLAMPAILRAAPMMEALTIYGPPGGPSIVAAYAVATNAFADIAARAEFKAWKDPDELRAGLSSDTMGAVILPTLAAANLYNRGLGLRLVNTMTDGVLHILTMDSSIKTLADLKGHKLVLPFRHDTPDIIFARLMEAAGMAEGSVEIVPASSPVEAVQLLLTGRADAALLPEPAATMAEMRAGQEGKEVFRPIDIQKAWGELTGIAPVIPQAGLGLGKSFSESWPDAADALQATLVKAVADVITNPQEAAAKTSDILGMPAPILAKSIPQSALTATPANESRPALEAMFKAVMEVDPKIIGGKLPDDGFYLL